ncbi:MAG: serine/threonine-protein phosphatase [Armatimonadetes bacterium]|nr:serine/threonine-protein phosphatase [Armatimonadota bacterium]
MLSEHLRALGRRVDRRVERIVAEGVPDRARRWYLGGLAILLVLLEWLHVVAGMRLGVDLFFLAVIASCFIFRRSGLWIIPICLVLYDLPYLLSGSDGWDQLIVRSLVAVLTWVFLGVFTTVTLSKYAETRRYQNVILQDVALARTLQRSLMPAYFESDAVRVDARIAQTMQIGGDFYYFRPFKEKYVVVSLGDIMGKGIPASMVMAIVMGFFYEWGKQSFSPSFILERLNERLYSLWTDDESWFVTMFYAIYDEETHEFVYTSGGHQAALLIHADPQRPIERLKVDNLPIGIFEDMKWDEKSVVLEPGDRVAVFTDGVNEARNPAGEIFTMERVEQVLRENLHLSPGEIARAVVKRVRAFAGSHDMQDDLAIMIMEVKA